MMNTDLLPWFERLPIKVKQEIFPLPSLLSYNEQWAQSTISFKHQFYYDYI